MSITTTKTAMLSAKSARILTSTARNKETERLLREGSEGLKRELSLLFTAISKAAQGRQNCVQWKVVPEFQAEVITALEAQGYDVKVNGSEATVTW